MTGEPTRDTPRRPDLRTLLAFGTMVLLLGLNFVAVRFSNRELAPFWGSGLRFALAAALLLALAAFRRVPLPRGRALGGAVAYGALAFGASYALLYRAMVEVSAGLASILFATVPLLTFFLATGTGLERFRWRGFAGALLAVGGIAVVFLDRAALDVRPAAALAVLAGAACAAASGVVLKRAPRTHPVATNAVGMGVGAALLLAGSGLAREPFALPSLAITWAALAWLVATSIVGFMLFVWVTRRWTASAVSYATVLFPLVATAAGAGLAGEPVTLALLVGGALVLLGVYVGALLPDAPRATPVPGPAGAPPAR